MVPTDRILHYNEVLAQMMRIYREYTSICSFQMIGMSHDGRKIPMMRIGTRERCVICTAGIHGRETINTGVMLMMIESYAKAYKYRELLDGKFDVRRLLDYCGICFMPLMNPDGYTIAVSGFDAIQSPLLRQTARQNGVPAAEWKYNARAMDINRNFLSASYIRQETSLEPNSENETKALVHLFNHQPSIAYLDFHCRGDIIFHYRSAMPAAYNAQTLKIANEFHKYSGYAVGTKEDEFSDRYSGGNSVNYYSERFNNPAITIETVPDDAEFPLKAVYLESVYDAVYLLPLVLIEANI